MISSIARTSMFTFVLFVAACANQATKPAPAPAAAPSPPVATQYYGSNGQKLAQVEASGDARTDEKRIADAKKQGYKLVNTNGEELFCRTDPKIGSRVQKETTCMTAKQLDDMHDQTRLGLSKLPGMASPNVAGK